MTTDDLPQPPGPQPGPGGAPAGGPPPRRTGDGFFDSIRRMGVTRSDNRWVGGVAGGVADRFGLDPLLVRGLLILSFFLTGAGIVIYAIAWALLPERDGRIHLQQAFRGDFDVALLGAVVALIVGFAWGDGLSWWGFGIEWVGALLWVAVWVAIVWLVVKLVRDRRPRGGGPGAPPAPPYPAAPPYPSAPAPGSTDDPASDGPRPTGSFTPAPPAPYLATPPAPQDPPAGPSGSWAAAPSTPVRSAPAAPAPVPSAPYGSWAAAPAPAAPVVPAPRPPRPVRRGPGAAAVGIVLGIVLLGGALLLVADRTGNLDLPFGPTWLGASIVVLGLGLVVTGLRGRRGGTLTFFAILALIAGLVTWPFVGDRGSWDFWDDSPQQSGAAAVISEGTVTPRSIEEAEDGVHVRFGSAVVDLTELDLSGVTPGDPVVVPVSMAAGSTVIRIPGDEAVEAEVQVIAGNATWHADGQNSSVNTYTNGPARFRTDEVHELDGARLLLDVDVRAGDLTIEESR
ncbi:PspC domain-containing protein [Isoptericola sp. NPDC019693]|uniref:PspC domain-containing protein n=1 Tax=Isoptericola sp. NPDC019693 TaxID=3364009 RepID=UPI00378CB0AC